MYMEVLFFLLKQDAKKAVVLFVLYVRNAKNKEMFCFHKFIDIEKKS